MAEVMVSGEISVPVEQLWKLLLDFGSVGWMQGVSDVKVEGEGVGMVRAIFAGEGEAILEELESVDADAQCIGYTISRNNPMPVSDYHALCTAVDLGDGRCRLDWGCTFSPAGTDEATAVATVEGMYGVLIGWVREALESD
ncbi:MAG: SRPBCC family protein [Myxococcota bacterium]